MKNKIAIITLSISLITSPIALAQNNQNENNFSKQKVKIISNLNKEKSAIEKEISCINSATKREEAKACHKERKAFMKKLKTDRASKEKSRLEERFKKFDKKSNQID